MKDLSDLILSVKTRIAMEMDAPEVLDLSDEAIAKMAVDLLPEVMQRLTFEDLQGLVTPLAVIQMVNDSADLPDDFFAVKDVYNEANKKAIFYPDFNNYTAFDEHSALMTPDANTPISSIADGKIYLRPTGTSLYLSYIKKHPALSDTQGTLLSSFGDKLLEDMIVAKYFAQAQDYNRANMESASLIGAKQ